jgi:tRNA G18 (ribose-2'-O)-methylase SpoU
MGPGADSLNVATAAAVALYELRQHQRKDVENAESAG